MSFSGFIYITLALLLSVQSVASEIPDFVECERVLRPASISDRDFVVALSLSPQVNEMANTTPSTEEELIQSYPKRAGLENDNPDATFLPFRKIIWDETKGVRVGTIGGFIGLDEVTRQKKDMLLGYNIAPSYWGQGWASWALQTLVDESIQQGIEYFYTAVTTSNVASIRVLEKAGFKDSGHTVTAEEQGIVPLRDEIYRVYVLDLRSASL